MASVRASEVTQLIALINGERKRRSSLGPSAKAATAESHNVLSALQNCR
jgi:hypothetical protein